MPLFDSRALTLFRDRAARRGGSFLDDRIWEEIDARAAMLSRRPETVLLLGPSTPAARRFAERSNLRLTTDIGKACDADLALAVRWAESEDDLPEQLAALAVALGPSTPLIGASIGGDSLRSFRAALLDADRYFGAVSARAHPRIEPASYAELLQRSGFIQPVVDLEPVAVRYSSVQRLVEDLRDLGASNALAARPRRGVSKAWRAGLEAVFPPGTEERFDVIHFAAWTAAR